MSDARLTWGTTSLIPTPAEEAEYRAGTRTFLIEVVEGSNFGNPAAQVTAIRSHLQDGSLASITSFDNRQGPLQLRVRSKTYPGLDAGAAALAAERNVPGFSTLTWTPNVSLAYPTVFDVVYADLGWKFDDLGETKVGNGEVFRYFEATIESLPFGRDGSLTTVQATTGSTVTPTTVSIDTGSSASGWSALNGSAPSSNGAQVSTAGLGYPTGDGPVYLVRSGLSVNVTSSRVIYVDWSQNRSSGIGEMFVSNGTNEYPATLVATALQSTGFLRSYFQVPAQITTTVAVITFGLRAVPAGGVLAIDQLSLTNVVVGSGTNRQQSRSLVVGGSARARASLAIAAPAGQTLGDMTLLYTRTASTGLQPPLRPYRTSSAAVTVDTSTLSGATNSLGGSTMNFLLPASRVREAAHLLATRLLATTAGTYTVSWSVRLLGSSGAGAPVVPESSITQSGTVTLTFPTANVWGTYELGLLQLPTVPVAMDSDRTVNLQLNASSAAVQIDEGWLFDLDNGVLSWVNTTGLTRLEARTADLTNPEPSYWGGSTDGGAATALVRADWRVVSFGVHTFEPGAVDVFTVTPGTEGSSCAAMFNRTFLHTASAA